MGIKRESWKADFPLLMAYEQEAKPLVYLDSAATSQKPASVLRAARRFYEADNANPHRGSYALSVKATEVMEGTRAHLRRFLDAPEEGEFVFTKNATEALNLVAYSYGLSQLGPEDEILLAISEHHSNLVPWQMVAKSRGAKLVYLYCDEHGQIRPEELERRLSPKSRVLAIAQASNVTGAVQDLTSLLAIAREHGLITVVDGTQAMPHMPVSLSSLRPDFYVASGHKLLAPMGVGFLYARKALLEVMPPFLLGGDMIEYVREQSATFAPIPQKFEAGTANVAALAGLDEALSYLESIGMAQVAAHEAELCRYLLERLNTVKGLRILGSTRPENRLAVVSFTMEGAHPHDIATILDQENVAIRSGHHCAQPLHRYLNAGASARASLYIYNEKKDIDRLMDGLEAVRRWFPYGA